MTRLGPRRLALLPLACLLAQLLLVAPVAAAGPPAPEMWIYDAPFTRNQSVELALVQRTGEGGNVVARRASNDPAVDGGGVLVNGVTVADGAQWLLAAGPPGPRTVYGQFKYASGVWSAVSSITVTLDATVDSRIYVDADPRAFWPTPAVPLDYHEIVETPDEAIFASAYQDGPTGKHAFNVAGGDWGVSFGVDHGPITPGTYDVDPPISQEQLAPTWAGLSGRGGEHCNGDGTFTIDSIEFAGGDLVAVSAEFQFTCLDAIVAGSVRYGADDPIVAMDQSVDIIDLADTNVGQVSGAKSVTVTNIGPSSTSLGDAEIATRDADDFAITADGCSDTTLAPGQSCTVQVRFEPVARGGRFSLLRIPDETAGGARRVFLRAVGYQPTSLAIGATDIPEFGPAEATFELTMFPDTSAQYSNQYPVLAIDGVVAHLGPHHGATSPSRRVFEFTSTVTPGHHVATGSFEAGDFFLGSTAAPVAFDVGISTSLELTTTTDDGVALGESATLVARLQTGAAIPGGTLRIRDEETDAIVATASVSGDDPSLEHAVTRGLGIHPYSAEFVPPSSTVQASSDTYDLTVVSGTRPETVMPTTPLLTNWTTAGTEFSSPDSPVTFECRVDVSNWFPCTSPTVFQHNTPGAHQLVVRAIGPTGLGDRTPATRDWLYDPWRPSVSTPTAKGLGITGSKGGTSKVRISWTGSDLGSGIESYAVERQRDGGTWDTIGTALHGTSLDATLDTGHTYRFRVGAIDKAGSTSDLVQSAPIVVVRYSDGSGSITYRGTWKRATSGVFIGDVARASSASGAKATLKTSMRSIGWISRVGPTRGKATVYVDGVRVATVDLHAAKAAGPRVVWSKAWSSAGQHQVTIRVSGTRGRPWVIVDGFVVTK